MLRRILLSAVGLVLALAAGIWLGGHPTWLPGPVSKTLVQKDVRIVGEGLNQLQRKYYREPDQRKVADAALSGAVDSLGDQYSAYIPPKDVAAFTETTRARFEGIGVEIQKVGQGLKVVRVYDGSPAQKAGLKANDVIVTAAGKSLAGLATSAASSLIRGPKGTSVKLVVLRGKERIPKTVKRDTVKVPLVTTRYDAKAHVGVVRLASFSEGAASQVETGIKAMQKDGAKAIVLDLRSNPGGLVDEAQDLSSLFLKGGTVVTMKGRAVPTRTLKAGDDPAFAKLPVVLLVDRNSASASEIVTGALQDRDRAKVVGTRTYGKGVFQEIMDLSSGGQLDITVGQYYTPKGRNLGGAGVTKGQDVSRGKGLVPDVRATDDPATKPDEAAEKAISIAEQAIPASSR